MENGSSQTFESQPLALFRQELASKASVPGGGGAAALAGALAASLLTMVGNLTVGKKKYAAYEEELRALMEKTEDAAVELLHLVDEDAQAFAPLAKAYSLPKSTPGEIEEKNRIMEECLKRAADVPMRIMEKAAEVIPLIDTFLEKGSVLAVSDAGCSAALAEAALKSAYLNVLVNTRLMKDRLYAGELNARCDALLKKYVPMAEKSYQATGERLGQD